jgi:hypothetical protein
LATVTPRAAARGPFGGGTRSPRRRGRTRTSARARPFLPSLESRGCWAQTDRARTPGGR